MKNKRMRRWGMGTLEVVMIIALAAIVGVAIYGLGKYAQSWSSDKLETVAGSENYTDPTYSK